VRVHELVMGWYGIDKCTRRSVSDTIESMDQWHGRARTCRA